MTHLEQAIKDAVEKGGYGSSGAPNYLNKRLMNKVGQNWRGDVVNRCLLDPAFWQALGKARGWKDSRFRFCEMKMPFYHNEKMRGNGVIVGESKDEKQWYVRWDNKQNGEKAHGMTKYPYPKENIIEKSSNNWQMVWHRLIDHLASGKDIEIFFETL